MKKYSFKEEQKFTQWWLWMILIIVLVFPPLINSAESANYYLLIDILIIGFIFLMKLTVRVSPLCIHYQFFPFHFKERILKKEEIKDFQEIKYNPIIDYGGWGIRWGIKGKAYNVKGNKGVRILKIDGKKILFGSQLPQSFIVALKKLRKD